MLLLRVYQRNNCNSFFILYCLYLICQVPIIPIETGPAQLPHYQPQVDFWVLSTLLTFFISKPCINQNTSACASHLMLQQDAYPTFNILPDQHHSDHPLDIPTCFSHFLRITSWGSRNSLLVSKHHNAINTRFLDLHYQFSFQNHPT